MRLNQKPFESYCLSCQNGGVNSVCSPCTVGKYPGAVPSNYEPKALTSQKPTDVRRIQVIPVGELGKPGPIPAPVAFPSYREDSPAHYKSLAIDPYTYCHANKLDAFQLNAIKYITRHKAKGRREDILKAIHTLKFYLDAEYPQ